MGARERVGVVPSDRRQTLQRERDVRILVVEDNQHLALALRSGLEEHGFSVDVAHRCAEAEELTASEQYDLLVLDVMLPDGDGVALCRNLRRRRVSTYVLMLTGLSATSEKVAGLGAGADDYLTKPFEFEELVARIRALLRRGQPSEAVLLEVEGLRLDLLRREVSRDGHRILLRGKEMALLELLMRNAGRVVERTIIAQKLWDVSYEPTSNTIDKCVSSLRQKIDRGFEPPLIHTVRGAGYCVREPETAA